MLIYIFLAIFLLSLLFVKDKEKIYIALFFLFCLNVCRDYSVGTDYGLNYKRIYDQSEANNLLMNMKLSDGDVGRSVEIGWTALQYEMKVLGLSFAYVNFVVASIIIFFLFLSLKQSPIPMLSIVLYVLLFRYFASYNILRQSVAVIVFLYSIKYIVSKEFLKYLFFCALAMCFHLSALLLLPLYFVQYLKMSARMSIILILAVYVLTISNMDLVIFSWLGEAGIIMKAYTHYFLVENELNYPIAYLYIPSVLLFIPYLYLVWTSKIKLLDVYSKFYVFAIMLSVLTIHYEALFRVNEYFMGAVIIALPLMLKVQNRHKPLSSQMLVLLGCSVLYYSVYVFLNANTIRPYTLIF